ncbi:MAG: N-6 DNA methylase [Dactylosporangium sp.]|nr:N-6 DNA methylase [Dactylosporangium sp.]NNJ61101.1 N-6 DNA methylase [Dactylosporangium sp.]
MSDPATTVTQAQIAGLAGVSRAAVTQWRRRHADFPTPISAGGGQFLLAEVLSWLSRRPLPPARRTHDDPLDVTYGDLLPRRPPPPTRSDPGTVLKPLLALGPQAFADAQRTDYLYLLHCLAFLRLHDHDRWIWLMRHLPADGDPGMARRLLRQVIAAVDASIGWPPGADGPDAPAARLQPRAFGPVHQIMLWTAHLSHQDFHRLRALYLDEARVRSDAICTPTSIAAIMAALLATHHMHGDVRVYDPFARFGELLAEFAHRYTSSAVVQVYADHPRHDELRLAGMWLAATGTPASLSAEPSPPRGGATFLLANPPFGRTVEPTRLRDCVAALAPDGRAAVLLPYGAGFEPGAPSRAVRRDLVEQGSVLAVVVLPARMFPRTRIGVCVWLLCPPTGQATPVQFVDARQLGQPPTAETGNVHVFDPADIERIAATVRTATPREGLGAIVTVEEIREHGYSLHPPEYLDRSQTRTSTHAAHAELDAMLQGLDIAPYTTGNDQGWPRFPLRDLCDIASGVPAGTLKKFRSWSTTNAGRTPVVHPRHLRDGRIDASDAPRVDATVLEDHRLNAGDVLWVRTGAMGQVAIVRPDEAGWLQHTNLLRLRVTDPDRLDPGYLLACLSQAGVQARIRDRSIRSLTTSLSTATLGDLEIPLPPAADQQRILGALGALDTQAAAIERHLAAVRAARIVFGRHLTDGTIVLTGRETP